MVPEPPLWHSSTSLTIVCLARGSVGDCHEQGSFSVERLLACALSLIVVVPEPPLWHSSTSLTIVCLAHGSVGDCHEQGRH